jgi:hypothetical protein
MNKIPFEQLDKQAQKRRIVLDAIEQINLGVIISSLGDYFIINKRPIDPDYEEYNLQTLIRNGKKCHCCAKGTLFAACVLNVNDVYIDKDRYNYESFQKQKLLPWFSALELDMIETAFERMVVHDTTDKLTENIEEQGINRKTELAIACEKFGGNYSTATERMLGILNNILEYGTFTP